MANGVLVNESEERIKALHNSIDRIRACVSALRQDTGKRPFNDEIYITDIDLRDKLMVNRRTLHQWRTNGLLPYIFIGGKILYRESDIQALLDKHRFNTKK